MLAHISVMVLQSDLWASGLGLVLEFGLGLGPGKALLPFFLCFFLFVCLSLVCFNKRILKFLFQH